MYILKLDILLEELCYSYKIYLFKNSLYTFQEIPYNAAASITLLQTPRKTVERKYTVLSEFGKLKF